MHVSGAVNQEGVIELDEGARIVDAIEKQEALQKKHTQKK